MENFENMDWDALSSPADNEAEMKKIRKSIRKRNWKIVLTSVILVIALLVGTFQFAIPALESRYWDPSEATLSKYATDLELTFCVYSELFSPYHQMLNIFHRKSGFASYTLSIPTLTRANRQSDQYITAELRKNRLSLPTGFIQYAPLRFSSGSFDEEFWQSLTNQERRTLEQLPEYVRVRVCATFPKDLDLGTVNKIDGEIRFQDSTSYSQIDWIAIRGCDSSSDLIPQCGMIASINICGVDINETYPCLSLNGVAQTRLNLEQHFKSLLEFSIDRLEENRGIIPQSEMGGDTSNGMQYNTSADYYQNVLDYVNENGVRACGCYLTASPATILELLDSGTFSYIQIIDAWIGC